MKYRVIVLFAILFVHSLCFSFPENSNQEYKIKGLVEKEALRIYNTIQTVNPLLCKMVDIDGVRCVVALVDNSGEYDEGYVNTNFPKLYAYTFKPFAGTWVMNKKELIFEGEYQKINLDDDFEIKKIGNNYYLYCCLCSYTQGTAVAGMYDVDFTLFELPSLKSKYITYSSYQGRYCRVGEFYELEKFAEYPKLLKFLEKKISENEYVEKNDSSDINLVKNYRKKWGVENKDIKEVWRDYSTNFEPLIMPLYNKTILGKHGTFDTIENKNYIIYDYWKSDVIGYDKIKKKYFTIWIDSCNHGCDKYVSFLSNNVIEMIYFEASEQKVIVDLKKSLYRIVIKE
jgi:hypothetical protein